MLLLFLQQLLLTPICKPLHDILSSCKTFIDHPMPGPALDVENSAKTEADAGPSTQNLEVGGEIDENTGNYNTA